MVDAQATSALYYDRFALLVGFWSAPHDGDSTIAVNCCAVDGLYLTYSRSTEEPNQRASWFKRAAHDDGSTTDVFLRFDDVGGFWYIGPHNNCGSVAYAYNPTDSLVPPVSGWLMPVDNHEKAVVDVMHVRPDDPNRRKPWIKPAVAGKAAGAIDTGKGGDSAGDTGKGGDSAGDTGKGGDSAGGDTAGGGKRGGGTRVGGKGDIGTGSDAPDVDEPDVWEHDPATAVKDRVLLLLLFFFL
jgi:hypothetical protein